MVQQSQYGSNATEDPNSHLSTFLEICDTIKFNGVSDDAIKVKLFPFSLRDKAKVWLQSHSPNTFTTWVDLSKALLNKFFPPGKTAKFRMDTTSFCQQEAETLYEVWEHYRELQRKCPHHGLPDWLIIQTFYNGLTYPTKTHIDAVAIGALIGMLEVDTLNMLSAKMDNVVKMLNKHVVASSSSNQGVNVVCCTICGDDHDVSICASIEQQEQGNQQRPLNPPGFQYKQPPVETKPAWKLAIKKLVSTTSSNINQLAKATFEGFERVEGRLDQLTIMYRNIEVQIGQIANSLNPRNMEELLSKPEINPREKVNAITLRSWKQLKEPNLDVSCENKKEKMSKKREINKEKDHVVIDIDLPIPNVNTNSSIPFPHRLKQEKQEREFDKFFKIFNQLYINISLLDAIVQIPSYARFLRDIMSKKRKLVDNEIITLREKCSVVNQNKLSPKLEDPGSFSIPCTIGNIEFLNALCFLGASVTLIPLSINRKLGLTELRAANIILQLADRTIKYPIGILEDGAMVTHATEQKEEKSTSYRHEEYDQGIKGSKETISNKEVEYFPPFHIVKSDSLSESEKGTASLEGLSLKFT
nr:uncharacterized protein LOC113687382 [Coffea arabica]